MDNRFTRADADRCHAMLRRFAKKLKDEEHFYRDSVKDDLAKKKHERYCVVLSAMGALVQEYDL